MIAFSDAESALGRQIREAVVDHQAFERPLKVCELATCRATCCHDGVVLEADEKRVIGEVIGGNRRQLESYGWREERCFEDESGRGRSVTLAADEVAADHPDHFPRTRCVFLDQGHRCVLQRLATDAGRHPWWWKPVSCWMHPLVLRPGTRGGRPVLTLAGAGNDPAARAGYPGFSSCTPCGREAEGGSPAWHALSAELELLGKIGGRDLARELRGDERC